MAETAGTGPVQDDAFLGGKVRLYQSARGHRAGTDAALLAAAAPADFSGLVLDIGAGVGAASIALAATRPGARIGLVEIDAEAAELARKNLDLNGIAQRGRVFEADALSPPSRRAAGLADETADLVISNPPFLDPARSRASPDEGRRRAHVMREGGPAGVVAWLAACLALTRPGGSCIVIHRPDSLAALLASLEGRAGEAVLMPIHPRAGAAAIRILLRARKGSRAPLSIVPGLILHDDAGFSPKSEAIHRGQACLDW
ncbi:methyltransferase small [Methylocella silvestris BL2]|uniref:Methyltransferase small n=1 Tax=Methylocella silvestris (strain DSM 15510 / CIP 108128 / LMG 27833 / NCIMB 13906 / BL2) TaxID=395965 RepID=B8ENF1_METSB|nr:methyltransferase [Methylocella silvestris]ACK50082.1 methyltransferase small [Methylocella silvestris BL2]